MSINTFVQMTHNVRAVYDGLRLRIRALRSKDQQPQTVGGGWRGSERSDRPSQP